MTKTIFKLGLAAFALGFAGQALAYAQLKSAISADKSTIKSSPGELDLTFTEGLNLKFSGIKVTGPDKASIKLDDPMLKQSDTVLMVPLSGMLGAGTYTVEWHALSTDGHKTNGSYTFTVKP
ncbi:copper homeostasis periplasmic binding protein CopC [Rhizobium calliandrae]|uniref:Copper homeostasis periplasmic binding protein CopC n=1 Tax=Rhizobium calliandrae TaxID=1312182 RepID=A0ABT7KP22_9HYPH|nr:copper homeostasis periplasmic binding protein CopC [Rhizobium calliandrae]MDL2410361.1 copper homeostasis periplasmic binding protein CopC [Rhizobium calliandrae]